MAHPGARELGDKSKLLGREYPQETPLIFHMLGTLIGYKNSDQSSAYRSYAALLTTLAGPLIGDTEEALH